MKVRWTVSARLDRTEIRDYIAEDNRRAAATMDKLFSDAASRLAAHPEIGKAGKIPGTREWIPHRSYRLVYEIKGSTVWILSLVHTARRWPPVQE